ncbi:MAG: isocitrate lyase [Flavobacteriales bacterium]|nr:isocitrate lyase [Bacteroidales bacterium AH-315-I05]PCJ84469.1 MAG: isocitrate lyase [Flavobacteriales bacterium]
MRKRKIPSRQERIDQLVADWQSPRWEGVERPYTAEEVVNLRGSIDIEYTLASAGANKLWEYLCDNEYVTGLGALTGNQAIQEVQAGLRAIYCSGWQVAADANLSGTMYPDQSLYPADSVPNVVRRINNALLRSDQVEWALGKNGKEYIDYLVPIIADAEAGFGGNLNAFELMREMIVAGAGGVHFEDQLSSAKKCGHLGGKVLVPTQEAIQKLVAARLAADVMDVSTILIARTDADAAGLITSDVDERDHKFIVSKDRTTEGFYVTKEGLEQAINRALSYAPYADLIWCETSKPDIGQAREFAQAVHEKYPDKMLAYNCSPSFNWSLHLDRNDLLTFREQLAEMGYKFQFITLAGFHSLNCSMFELSKAYKAKGMAGYSMLQQREIILEKSGYQAVKHQSFVGTGYFDIVQQTVMQGEASTIAMEGSTEVEQFE